MDRIVIPKPDDFHLHLRNRAVLHTVAPFTDKQFARAIIMPNTKIPVLTSDDVRAYRAEIFGACGNLEPLMTIKITPKTTAQMVREAKKVGAVAGKIFPEGVTTGAEDGVVDVRDIYSVLEELQKQEMLALWHGEQPGAFCLDREDKFLPVFDQVVSKFPGLRMVLEHLTTANAVQAVLDWPDTVAATITVHHLFITLDDVIGDKAEPHNFCKPVAKRPEDRDALQQAAMSGNPKFFFGSDSAPHTILNKECAEGMAGVFTAPVAMPLLATLFEECGELNMLEGFVSCFGAQHYGLPQNEGTLMLIKETWKVPMEYDGIRPFFAGKDIPWKVAEE